MIKIQSLAQFLVDHLFCQVMPILVFYSAYYDYPVEFNQTCLDGYLHYLNYTSHCGLFSNFQFPTKFQDRATVTSTWFLLMTETAEYT